MIKLKSFLIAALAVVGLSFTAEAAKTYGPKDYSQKRLLAQWDCSQGVDETGWTDLVSGRKFTWNSGHTITFDENGIHFPGNNTSYGTLADADTAATFDKVATTLGTIEIVFKGESNSGKTAQAAYQTPKTTMYIWGAGTRFATSSASAATMKRADDGSMFGERLTAASHYSCAATSLRRGYTLLNGVRSAYNSSGSTSIGTSGKLAVLGNRQSLAAAFKGTIYAIRIYNRQLSYVEIEEHARIDAIRFDGAEDTQFIEKIPMEKEFVGKGYKSTFIKEGVEYTAESFTNVNGVTEWMVPPGVQSIDLLIVGGGASAPQPGGNYAASGSGAGAVVFEENYAVTPGGTYTIQVGAGGAAVRKTTAGTVGNDGSNSTFYLKDSTTDGFTALGGGTGGWGQNSTTAYDAHDGGCGGGASYGSSGFAGGKSKQFSTYGYGMGKDGGATGAGKSASGGGATQAGSAQASLSDSVGPVRGGAGFKTDISGVMLEYARGGDGGMTAGASEGIAGGGADGFDGRGDGGTPAGGYRPEGSGKGGDGVVIIRYAVPRLGTGVQISAEGGQYGTPNPDYGYIEKDFPEVYTCPSEVVIDEGVRAVLTGWALYDVDNNLVDSSANHPGDPITTASFTVDKALTLKWQWKKECLLTATAGENGALKNEVSGWYEEGSTIEVEAVPNTGYGLFNWTGDVAEEDAEKNPLTFTMGTKPLSVSAVFAQAIEGSYTVVSSAETQYGEVTPAYGDTEGTFLVGKTLSFSAPQYVVLEENASRIKCAGYKVYSKASGEVIAEGSPAAVGGVVSVEVTFSELFTFEWQWVAEYYVETACDAEQGLVTGAGWYEAAAEVSVQAMPKSVNFAFDFWAGDVATGSEKTNPLVFAMPAEKVALTANFVALYPINVTTYHGYTVSVQGGTSSFPAYFREGALVTLQYGPNATAKYTWTGLPEDAVIDEAARTVSFTMPAEPLNLTLDGEDVINPDMGWIKTYVQNGVSYTAIGFTKTGVDHTFTVPEWVEAIDYLVVGGGGAGGSSDGSNRGQGGGGAGAFVTNDAPVSVESGDELKIHVGAGGLPTGTDDTAGGNGESSSLMNGENVIATALGGGGGAGAKAGARAEGAYGGGGSTGQKTAGVGELGLNGGAGANAGGGGGAGACKGGVAAAGSKAGNGGDGLPSSISGEEVWYAGGGGGGCNGAGSANRGLGGNGGGGDGGRQVTSSTDKGVPGTDGTGGGGGGGGYNFTAKNGAKGGSGIVIIRYRNQATLTVTGTPKDVAAVEPGCGEFEYVSGEVVECTANEYFQTASGVREYCLGWELLDAAGNVVRSSATTEDPAESACVAKVALAESMTLNWLWETRYELSVVSADTEKGTVTGGGYYAEGALVEITATPTEGYRFTEWSNVDDALKGSTPIQITTGSAPLTITATFGELFEGGVTVAAEGGELGTPDPAYGDHAYEKDQEVTFSAGEIKVIDQEDDSRMALVGWKLYDNADLTTPIRTSADQGEQYDTMTLIFGETSETLKWVWEKQYLATKVAAHGEVKGPDWVAAGASATYTAVASDGYRFDKWLLNGEEAMAEEDGSLVVADVESAYTVEATFVEIPWGIDVVERIAQDGAAVSKTTNNRIFVDGPYEFTCPAEYVTLTENDTRLKCVGYTVNGDELVEGLTANVTFSRTQDPMPMTIEWQYETEYYLEVAVSGEGTVDVASGWRAENAELTLTATPNEGYSFSNWKVDGEVKLGGSIEITMTAATKVEACFYDPATKDRTWTGAQGSNWSAAGNWYPAVLPTAEDDVVIPSGASVNLNNASSFAVKNLTISNATVTITQTGINTTFEIGGNLKLMNGGKITCSSFTGTSSIRAINLTVNGEEGISIDETSQITASGTAQIEYSPGHSSTAYYGSSYGGRGGFKGGAKVNSKECYGSIRKPHNYGSRGPWPAAYAGGIIHLIAANGSIAIAKGGKISADAVKSSSGGGEGSGGSVWIEATAVTGAGLVSARSVIGISDSVEGGAGRVAVYQTEAATSDNLPKLDASAIGPRGGAGTVYVENANDNGRGWLIVEGCGSAPTPDGVACCIEGDVADYAEPFRKITIKNCANFVVAKGFTLKTGELDIKGNGTGKIFANYKDVVMEGYGTIKVPQGLAIMFN